MSVTRFTQGAVTVTLDGALEAIVRKALDAAAGQTVRLLEGAAQQVADQARSKWYSQDGVKRRTGKSGDIQVVTTVSDTEVRVSVGSTDLERAKFIHRPARLSTVAQEITSADYWKAKRAGGITARHVFQARRARPDQGVEAGKFYQIVHNPAASDGKFLLPVLVTSPMRVKVQAITPELGRAIAEKAGG